MKFDFDKAVDNSGIIILRIFFGLLIFLESMGSIFTGWVKKTFVDPPFTFTFIDFSFLQILNGPGMYLYYFLMSLPALAVMLGYRYKWSLSIFGVMWTVTYLSQKTHYNNHYYLIILLCFLFLLVPAASRKSLDSKSGRSLYSETCPAWCYWIFKWQFAIVFFYAALAKLNPDWLNGEPITTWLRGKSNYPLIGPFLGNELTHVFVVYGGILFDLLIAPALFWKRTRWLAFSVAVFFHLFNSAVFQIGVFPYLMIFYGLIFFDPKTLGKKFLTYRSEALSAVSFQTPKLLLGILLIYFSFQAIYPARHFAIPGNVNWTEEGHRHSWRMMLRSKRSSIHFTVKDKANGETWKDQPHKTLSKDQYRKMGKQPDMIWQYAQHLKQRYQNAGRSVAVYAKSRCGLNGRKMQEFIDPNVDLAAQSWEHLRASSWITPLDGSKLPIKKGPFNIPKKAKKD